MSLRSYLRILRERWATVVAFVLVATALAVVVTALTPATYQATAQVLVVASNTTGALQNQDNTYVQYQVTSYAKTIDNPDVAKYVEQDLHLGLSARQIKDKISATASAGESIISVSATDGSAARATELANSAAYGFRASVEKFSSSVKLFVTGPADQPSAPVSPKPVLNVALGLLLGLLLGAAVAVVRDLLDNRIKNAESLAKTADAPVMGVIVEDPSIKTAPIAARSDARTTRAENFRQMRANLQFANVDDHPRVLAVTSSIPAEGKTSVAINLAATLAEAGFTVCLVDADLRRPTVASVLGLTGAVGLTNVLIQQVELHDALQTVEPNLYVLASGPTPPNPSEVLASTYVRDAIRSLLDTIDYVVIDTAPLLPVADGSEVAALADGTLLVARQNVTTETHVKHASQNLSRVDARLLGVVLNRVPVRRGERDYGFEYYRNEEVGQSLQKKNGRNPKARNAKPLAQLTGTRTNGHDREADAALLDGAPDARSARHRTISPRNT
ncbi:tyrosine-protein kinase domain-containing protein [Jatrophihabitans fulvus]